MELSEAIKDVIRVWGHDIVATPHVFVYLMAKNAFEGNLWQMQIYNSIMDLGYTNEVLEIYGDNEWDIKISNIEVNLCATLSSSFDEQQVKYVFHSLVKGIFGNAYLNKIMRHIILKEGQDVVTDFRIVNILDDSHVFQNDKLSKQILRAMIERDDTKKLVNIGCWNKQAQAVCDKFVFDTGYDGEQASQLFQSIAYGLECL